MNSCGGGLGLGLGLLGLRGLSVGGNTGAPRRERGARSPLRDCLAGGTAGLGRGRFKGNDFEDRRPSTRRAGLHPNPPARTAASGSRVSVLVWDTNLGGIRGICQGDHLSPTD